MIPSTTSALEKPELNIKDLINNTKNTERELEHSLKTMSLIIVIIQNYSILKLSVFYIMFVIFNLFCNLCNFYC